MSSSGSPVADAIVRRHAAFKTRTVQYTLPASGIVEVIGPNPRRWAVILSQTTGGSHFMLWGGSNKQTIGIPFSGSQRIKLDAADYPGLICESIWIRGALAQTGEVTEIVAVG